LDCSTNGILMDEECFLFSNGELKKARFEVQRSLSKHFI